jgi:hypothetical protein
MWKTVDKSVDCVQKDRSFFAQKSLSFVLKCPNQALYWENEKVSHVTTEIVSRETISTYMRAFRHLFPSYTQFKAVSLSFL